MKILVISHNSFSTFQSMGKTFCSLFSTFRKEELCQLYIYPTIPDIDACNSYYRVTDKDVLYFFKKLEVYGREIRIDSTSIFDHRLFENRNDESFYKNKKNHSAFRCLARDFLWASTPWFNKSLKEWLRKECITHIFVAPGGYKFIYNIALKCSRFLNVPIVTYVCDEYFFTTSKKRIIDKIKDVLLKCKMKQLMSKTSLIVTISEELKNLYEPYFKKHTKVIMTGTSFPITSVPLSRDSIKELTYMGSIRCNRYMSLCDIGDTLDEINREYNEKYSLNIYSGETDYAILNELKKRKSIKLKGFVSGESFKQVFYSSQCILHVEAFDECSIDCVKNSISTKIADCLGSGILLMAYGPSQIASMQHLIRNNCAVFAGEKNDLKNFLLKIFAMSEKDRSVVINNALATANKYHNTNTNGNELLNAIARI